MTGGAPFSFAVTSGMYEVDAEPSGKIGVAFLVDGMEVERHSVDLQVRPVEIGSTQTDGDGVYEIPIDDFEPGRIDLVVSTPGDVTTWPSQVELTVQSAE